MFDSDRGKRTPLVAWVFPIIGIVLALSLAFGIGSLVGSSPRDPATKQQQQAYAAAQGRYARSVARNFADPQSNYSAYPDQHADPCYYAPNHDSADLCAQWRAALAAEDSARWAEAGFWVGLLGTVLSGVGLTALLFSLRQTERSLSEARAANAIARQTALIQTRPWVSFGKVEIEITAVEQASEVGKAAIYYGAHFKVSFQLRNTGPTPAADFEYRIEISDYASEMPTKPVFHKLLSDTEDRKLGGFLPAHTDQPIHKKIFVPLSIEQDQRLYVLGIALIARYRIQGETIERETVDATRIVRVGGVYPPGLRMYELLGPMDLVADTDLARCT